LVKQFICGVMSLLMIAPSVSAGNVVKSATYYSDWFVGRKMANGKRFHQHTMVAAHPTYRLGTRLRVRYKKRSVVVVVTDRCRCSIDLSKAAFRKLAPLRKGRIRVRVSKL
jgi:rare lipoprotein A